MAIRVDARYSFSVVRSAGEDVGMESVPVRPSSWRKPAKDGKVRNRHVEKAHLSHRGLGDDGVSVAIRLSSRQGRRGRREGVCRNHDRDLFSHAEQSVLAYWPIAGLGTVVFGGHAQRAFPRDSRIDDVLGGAKVG